jgi:hypothetical protein
MAKYVKFLMLSTFIISPLYAMKTDAKNEDEPSVIIIHQKNVATIVEQQKNILLQMNNLQKQMEELTPNFEKFLKSSEVVGELKKKKMKERFTQKMQARITSSGDVAVEKEKRKWKTEKINNYRLHTEKVEYEIKRATDEGRTTSMVDGIKYYEVVSILRNAQWISIGDFRKIRNEEFDEKQRTIKKALFEKVRKEAEKQETVKIYKEQLQAIDML